MNIAKLMKQAQKMQSDMAKVQAEVAKIEKSCQAGGGAVTVTAFGNGTLKSITIAKDLLAAGDAEMLQDMILVAANGALEDVKKEAEARMSSVTAGLQMPGMF
jgi:DNA-binding YbaB/EbfC family protein